MGVLADWQIELEKIVEPFVRLTDDQARGKITFGIGHYGYDVRCSREFQVFSPRPVHAAGAIIDPKKFDVEFLESRPAFYMKDGAAIIPQNSFALTQTVERLSIPRSVLATVVGKSTYARCGVICNVTPLEPEWRGKITIELSNTTPLPAKIYPEEGIAQVVFHRADGYTQFVLDDLAGILAVELQAAGMDRAGAKRQAEEDIQKRIVEWCCKRSYADKGGRYQDQGDKVVLPCASGDQPIQVDGLPGTGHR